MTGLDKNIPQDIQIRFTLAFGAMPRRKEFGIPKKAKLSTSKLRSATRFANKRSFFHNKNARL